MKSLPLLNELKQGSKTLSLNDKLPWGEQDAYAIAIAESLKENSGLAILELKANYITNAGLIALSKALETNHTLLSLQYDENSHDHIGILAFAAAIEKNTTLRRFTLSLADSKQGNAPTLLAAAIGANRTLQCIDISYSHLSATDTRMFLNAIARHPTLLSVDISDNDIDNSAGLAVAAVIKKNNVLTSFNVSLTHVDQAYAQDIANAIETNRTLRRLDFGANSNLHYPAKVIFSAFAKNRTVTYLGFRYNNVDDAGIALFAEALLHNHFLQVIDLSHNYIFSKGINTLVDLLDKNRTLTTINLDYPLNPKALSNPRASIHVQRNANELAGIRNIEAFLKRNQQLFAPTRATTSPQASALLSATSATANSATTIQTPVTLAVPQVNESNRLSSVARASLFSPVNNNSANSTSVNSTSERSTVDTVSRTYLNAGTGASSRSNSESGRLVDLNDDVAHATKRPRTDTLPHSEGTTATLAEATAIPRNESNVTKTI